MINLLTSEPPEQLNSWACFLDLTINLPTGFFPIRAWIINPLIVSPALLPWIFNVTGSSLPARNLLVDKFNLYGTGDNEGSTWCCGVISSHAGDNASPPAEYEYVDGIAHIKAIETNTRQNILMGGFFDIVVSFWPEKKKQKISCTKNIEWFFWRWYNEYVINGNFV